VSEWLLIENAAKLQTVFGRLAAHGDAMGFCVHDEAVNCDLNIFHAHAQYGDDAKACCPMISLPSFQCILNSFEYFDSEVLDQAVHGPFNLSI